MDHHAPNRSVRFSGPANIVGLVAATIGGLATAAPMAFIGVLLQAYFWGPVRADWGTRLMGLGFIALAGVFAGSGPLLIGIAYRSLPWQILGGLMIALGVTAAVVVGVVTA